MLPMYLSALENPRDIPKFEEIHQIYRGMMFRAARAVLKNNEDAEDATQEAFLKLAQNFSKISELSREKLEGFLITLSRNTAIDAYRKFQNKPENVDLEESLPKTGESTTTLDVLSEFLSKEGYQKIISLIWEMSDTYRDVMRLRFVLEYSNDEIAKMLGITKTNVETRVGRGRLMLIEMLVKEGYCTHG